MLNSCEESPDHSQIQVVISMPLASPTTLTVQTAFWPAAAQELFHSYMLSNGNYAKGQIIFEATDADADFFGELVEIIVDELLKIRGIGPNKLYQLFAMAPMTIRSSRSADHLKTCLKRECHTISLFRAYEEVRSMVLKSPEQLRSFCAPVYNYKYLAGNGSYDHKAIKKTFTKQDILRLREWFVTTGTDDTFLT